MRHGTVAVRRVAVRRIVAVRTMAVRIVAVEKEPAAAACAHTVSGAGGTVGVGVDDRPRAHVGCGVCEMSPIMLAAR